MKKRESLDLLGVASMAVMGVVVLAGLLTNCGCGEYDEEEEQAVEETKQPPPKPVIKTKRQPARRALVMADEMIVIPGSELEGTTIDGQWVPFNRHKHLKEIR